MAIGRPSKRSDTPKTSDTCYRWEKFLVSRIDFEGMQFRGDQSAQRLFRSAQLYSTDNPMLVIGAVVGVVVLGVSLWLVVRWIRRPKGARLKRALAKRDELVVLMHPNPDPDAMACGIAIAYLAETVGTEATLQYSGQIRHQENRAFRTILDLELDRVEHVTDLAASTIVLVDHNTPRGFDGRSESNRTRSSTTTPETEPGRSSRTSERTTARVRPSSRSTSTTSERRRSLRRRSPRRTSSSSRPTSLPASCTASSPTRNISRTGVVRPSSPPARICIRAWTNTASTVSRTRK